MYVQTSTSIEMPQPIKLWLEIAKYNFKKFV